jgi:hypothetical protein
LPLLGIARQISSVRVFCLAPKNRPATRFNASSGRS